MTRSWNLLRKAVGAICLLALFSQQVFAQSESEDDEWDHSLAIYLWGASMGGTTADGTGVEIDFKDILKNLELAFMGSYHARKGKWSFMSDVIYLDVSGDNELDPMPENGGIFDVTTTGNLDMKSWVIHMAGGYNLYDDGEGTTTDVVFGARYLDLSTDMRIDFDLSLPEQSPSISFSASDTVLDAIVGLRGVVSLGDRWFMPWGGNAGAGGSDLSWQAMVGVGYKASSWADIALTYRYLKFELDSDLVDDLSINGPLLGVIFRF
jgi:opacity protein-like surface antigen